VITRIVIIIIIIIIIKRVAFVKAMNVKVTIIGCDAPSFGRCCNRRFGVSCAISMLMVEEKASSVC